MLAVAQMENIEDAGALIDQWQRQWEKETGAAWAVCDSKDLIVGRIAVSRINLFEGDGEIGYWPLSHARGRGIAPTAVRAARTWAFTSIGLMRLQLTRSTRNEGSCRIAAKAGFPLEGVKRSAFRHHGGWHDMHLHAAVNTTARP